MCVELNLLYNVEWKHSFSQFVLPHWAAEQSCHEKLVTDWSLFQILHILNSWWSPWICQTYNIFSSEIQKDTSFDRLSGWHRFIFVPLAMGISYFDASWWKARRKRDGNIITHKCKIRWKQQKWDKVHNLSGIVKDSFI